MTKGFSTPWLVGTFVTSPSYQIWYKNIVPWKALGKPNGCFRNQPLPNTLEYAPGTTSTYRPRALLHGRQPSREFFPFFIFVFPFFKYSIYIVFRPLLLQGSCIFLCHMTKRNRVLISAVRVFSLIDGRCKLALH